MAVIYVPRTQFAEYSYAVNRVIQLVGATHF